MDILIATNTTYMLPTCVFLFSLCKSNSMNKVDIWLAYSDLTDEDFQKIESIISPYPSVTLHKLYVGISFKEKNNKIRFATYNEIDGPNFDPDSQFVQLSGLLSKYCKIIHYCASFKPWNYTRENIWKDFVPFSNYWYDAYEEMCDKFDFMKELH